jgi:hypothetical protein
LRVWEEMGIDRDKRMEIDSEREKGGGSRGEMEKLKE